MFPARTYTLPVVLCQHLFPDMPDRLDRPLDATVNLHCFHQGTVGTSGVCRVICRWFARQRRFVGQLHIGSDIVNSLHVERALRVREMALHTVPVSDIVPTLHFFLHPEDVPYEAPVAPLSARVKLPRATALNDGVMGAVLQLARAVHISRKDAIQVQAVMQRAQQDSAAHVRFMLAYRALRSLVDNDAPCVAHAVLLTTIPPECRLNRSIG